MKDNTMKLEESMTAECVRSELTGELVWHGTEAGSKEGIHEIGELIQLKADTFPEGTKVIILEPFELEDSSPLELERD